MNTFNFNAPFSSDALHLLQLFKNEGYQIFLVGGCVRDAILGNVIHDYDLCTDALPEQMIAIASKNNIQSIPTGIAHGTITWMYHKQAYEITTFRSDHEYKDFRRPEQVSFSSTFADDVARRDFTMNALGYDGDHIVDYVGGMHDIKHKQIRTVGNPSLRFQEDALRILRALRFQATLAFSIENETFLAIKKYAYLLQHISKERLQVEFVKILQSKQVDTLRILRNANVLDTLFPVFKETYDVAQHNTYHIYDVFEHMNAVVNASIGYPLDIRLALFFHDIKKKACKQVDANGITHFKGHAALSATYAKKILKEYRFSKACYQHVYQLIYYHDRYVTNDIDDIRQFMYELHGNYVLAHEILTIQKLDNMGKSKAIQSEKNTAIDEVIKKLHIMQEANEVFSIKELAVNGEDIKKLGYQHKEIGNVLNYLVKYVVHHQEKNNKKDLLEVAGGLKDEISNSK